MNKEEISLTFESNGFIKNNHYHLEEIIDDKVVVTAKITEEAKNPYGILHGGFVFGLGDTAMGIAAKVAGGNAVTLNANVSFLKPAKGNSLRAEAYTVKKGKTVAYIKADIYDEENRHIASMDSNYYYID